MSKKCYLACLLCFLFMAAMGQKRNLTFYILETTDVHGNYFPRDYINRTEGRGSLCRTAGYVDDLRMRKGADHVLLLDNGDILQGQPSAYYYNYVDTISEHVCAAVLNEMRYDAVGIGNHDIETGHSVYDRWVSQLEMPALGANVIDTDTEAPYWKPYTIIKKDGVRFAILGLVTPAIPQWLPEALWKGLRFDDMVETARKYMPEIKRQAAVVIGLFHSGVGEADAIGNGLENASLQVAKNVPGFDLILCGHDHRMALTQIVNTVGDTVMVMNAGPNATHLAQATIHLTKKNGHVGEKKIETTLIDITGREPDRMFIETFAKAQRDIENYVGRKIGTCEESLSVKSAFFGPSSFIDFIHRLQLDISGSDISFTAPLSLDAEIPAGDIHVSDMFNLYKYENRLCVMRLSGKEIRDWLEYSYDGWTVQMKSADDHMLRFAPEYINASERWQRLATPCYNFDSAAGLLYTVDLTKERGRKVIIERLADGRPFSEDSIYSVAVNSYRAEGGGGHVTEGAGIAPNDIARRIVWRSERDLRYYMMEKIAAAGTISPKTLNQWRFVPEDRVRKAALRDEAILYGN